MVFLFLELLLCFAIVLLQFMYEMVEKLPYCGNHCEFDHKLMRLTLVSIAYGILSLMIARIVYYHVNISRMIAASKQIKQIDMNCLISAQPINTVSNATSIDADSAPNKKVEISCVHSKLLKLWSAYGSILKLTGIIWFVETLISAILKFTASEFIERWFEVAVGMFVCVCNYLAENELCSSI